MSAPDELVRAVRLVTTKNRDRLIAAGGGRCLYCGHHTAAIDLVFLPEPRGQFTAMCQCMTDVVVPDDFPLTDIQRQAVRSHFWSTPV